jgi:hypothetical protein
MSDNKEEKKKGKGRPRERPTVREEARKKADQILRDHLAGGTGETDGAVRRRINLLGDNPEGGRWFSYSRVGTFARIVDTPPSYSSSNSSSSLSTSGVSRRTMIEEYEENEEVEEGEDGDIPEIHELQNSGVEIPTGIENLNQNIQGINEREARNDDYDDWYERTTARIVRNINAPPFERFEVEERDVDLEQMDDEYDTRILNEPSGSELENVERYMARNSFSQDRPYRGAPSPSGSVSDPSIESFPMSYAPMRSLVTERLQQMFGELGMQIPPEIQTMGVEALEGLMRDSGIKLNMDDVKNALSESGIENFESSTLPFSGLIESASNRLGFRNPFSRGFRAVRAVTERIPETLRKKVTEAGGSMIDALRFPSRTPVSSRGSPMPSPVSEAGSTVSEVMTNIFGRSPNPEEDPDGGEGGNESEVPKATKDPSGSVSELSPRDYLIDQINSINLRLEDVSKGNKLKYPEAKKITPFRFPRADENYSAVRLVQNATTSYLNDLNLYGTSFDDDI